MTVWSHLSTIFKQRYALRTAGLIALCVALTTTLLFANIARATTGVNQTLSFQGRLLSSGGSVVPDGNYNMQFKIYQDGSGTTAGNTDGTLKWTETYINNGGTAGIEIKNGFFSVNLGAKNPFGTSVDWNQDTLWLSMNVAGSSTSCTTFNAAPCVADGEMLPMKRITSTPYSLNSGMVGGKTADNLVQLSQGVQEDAANGSASVFINKTGIGGEFFKLQNNDENMLVINNAGNLQFGNQANHYITIASADAAAHGNNIVMQSGTGGSGSGSNGGDLVFLGGDGGGADGTGGSIFIQGGNGTGSADDGTIYIGTTNNANIQIGNTGLNSGTQTITLGNNNTSGGTTNVTVGSGGSAAGGSTTVQAKDDLVIKTDGTVRATFSGTDNTLFFGNGKTNAAPSNFKIQGTNSSTTAVTGGSLALQGGDATVGDANGGNITLAGGAGSGNGADGLIIMNTPTFSATTDDANCYASGALVATSCTIATTSVNSSSAILVGFSADSQTAALPDPTITTAGRVVYVLAADGSKDFTLSMNGGGTGNEITLQENTAATMMWNGSDWIVAGTSASTALQGNNVADGTIPNVQVGSGTDDGVTTLLTVDKATTAPTVTDSEALLGSMYYDTTIGKLQCYEADGWGSCSAAPDNFVTISPEYSNAVVRSNGTGTMTSDVCSDDLNINDGSSAQPTVCGTNETYNFYNWTSSDPTTTQTRSIYVTYQLPSTFKNFVAGSTSLMGRTDGTDSNVEYQVYRNSSSGLTACGSAVSVSTGAQTTWQKGTAGGSADPSACTFAAGDSLVLKIDLSAKNNANAYASTINFAFSSN